VTQKCQASFCGDPTCSGDHFIAGGKLAPAPLADSTVAPFDVVKKPEHYNRGTIEVWDFILDQELDFLSANVIKYVCRHLHKGAAIQDLKKARAYLEKRIAYLEAQGKTA
jgi:hypothetical protein